MGPEIFLSILATACTHLLIPILVIFFCKNPSRSLIKKVAIINGIVLFIIFYILYNYIGEYGKPYNGAPVVFWSFIGYGMMKYKFFPKKKIIIPNDSVENIEVKSGKNNTIKEPQKDKTEKNIIDKSFTIHFKFSKKHIYLLLLVIFYCVSILTTYVITKTKYVQEIEQYQLAMKKQTDEYKYYFDVSYRIISDYRKKWKPSTKEASEFDIWYKSKNWVATMDKRDTIAKENISRYLKNEISAYELVDILVENNISILDLYWISDSSNNQLYKQFEKRLYQKYQSK